MERRLVKFSLYPDYVEEKRKKIFFLGWNFDKFEDAKATLHDTFWRRRFDSINKENTMKRSFYRISFEDDMVSFLLNL